MVALNDFTGPSTGPLARILHSMPFYFTAMQSHCYNYALLNILADNCIVAKNLAYLQEIEIFAEI